MDELEEIREDQEPLYNLLESLNNSTIPEEINPELDSDEGSSDIILTISVNKDPWTCGICKELFTDPVESTCCHDLFCEKCVISLKKCPRCKSSTSWVSNLPVRRIMEEMVVKCRHELCGKSFRKVELTSHEATCEMALVQCRNSPRCKVLCQKDIDLHCKEACEYRPVDCRIDCGKKVPLCDLEFHILYDCLNTEILCPQNCSKAMQRKESGYHILHSCQFTLISCMFFSYDGDYCGYKCLRSELEEHQLTCNLRKVKCSNSSCPERIVYKSISSHEEVCKYRRILCPNGCFQELLTGNLTDHFEACELQQINCSYLPVGCLERMERKELDKHLVEKKFLHCEMMANWVRESSFKIEKLNFDIQRAKQLFYEEIRTLKLAAEANTTNLEVENLDLFLC